MMPPVTPPFIPSTTFSGARPGYVFKSGQLGVGYYHENAGSAPFVCRCRRRRGRRAIGRQPRAGRWSPARASSMA